MEKPFNYHPPSISLLGICWHHCCKDNFSIMATASIVALLLSKVKKKTKKNTKIPFVLSNPDLRVMRKAD